MSTQSTTQDKDLDRKQQIQTQAPVQTPDLAPPEGQLDQTTLPNMGGGQANIQAQANQLSDNRFTVTQRQAMAQRMTNMGNSHMQRVVQAMPKQNGHGGGVSRTIQARSNGNTAPEVELESAEGGLEGLGGGSPSFAPGTPPPPAEGNGVVQRSSGMEEEMPEGDDLPTEEEKAAALAAAEEAKGEAQVAKSEGDSKTSEVTGEAEARKMEGEAPKQEAMQSLAEGPVKIDGPAAGQLEGAEYSQAPMDQTIAKGAAAGDPTSGQPQLSEGREATLVPGEVSGETAGEAAPQTEGRPGEGGEVAPPAPQGEAGGGGGGGLESATAAAQTNFDSAHAQAESPPDQAPTSATEDPGYQTSQTSVTQLGETEATHPPAEGEADEAQGAAESPQAELEGKAQSQQVGEMEQTETPAFDAVAFKEALMAKIDSLTPSTAEEADEFKEDGKLDDVKGEMQSQVAEEEQATEGPLEEKAAQEPDTGNVTPKPVTPLAVNEAGQLPAGVGAEGAMPKPKGQGEVETPIQASSQSLDQQMTEAEITEDQLANANEPEFQAALDAKGEAQTSAAEAPQTYRQFEGSQLSQAEADAVATAQESMQGMHTQRSDLLTQVDSEQGETKTKDEQAREKIANDINGIYEKTQTKVEEILSSLDAEVTTAFDVGAEAAKKAFEDYVDREVEAYKEERYGGWFGWAKWLKDKVMGMPEDINRIYERARNDYLTAMDVVIDEVVAIIGTGLSKAKAEVANGKEEIQAYVSQLPEDLQQIGQEAATSIQSRFDQLEQTINDKQSELIDSLASKYQENLQAVDARIEEMKEANKGLVQKAIDAVAGVIETIIKLKNMLLEVLSSAMDAVTMILQDPIGFISNLLSAVKEGLNNFVTNIADHLQTGFVEWLTGTMGEAGIQMPEDIFSLEGVLDLVLQILGLTWENFRSRAVGIFGETVVGALETGFELFVILQEEGLPGIMNWVQEELTSLKDEVIEGVKEMLITEVIEAGIKWIIGLLGGPAGAFIKAAMMIYDVVMWFIDNAERLASLVQGIVNSVVAIASGNLEEAANYVEQSLADFVPTAIGFLASLLGLGDLSKKVRKIIDKVQEPVNNAIDKVLNMIKDFVMKIAKMLGFGGEGEGEGDGQIGKEVRFEAEDESHKLWVDLQGSTATLMIASEPMSVEDRLTDWESRLESLDEEKRGQAQGLLGQARSLLGNADEKADDLAEDMNRVKKMEDADAMQQKDQALEGEQDSLAGVIRQLFEIFGDSDEGDNAIIEATIRDKERPYLTDDNAITMENAQTAARLAGEEAGASISAIDSGQVVDYQIQRISTDKADDDGDKERADRLTKASNDSKEYIDQTENTLNQTLTKNKTIQAELETQTTAVQTELNDLQENGSDIKGMNPAWTPYESTLKTDIKSLERTYPPKLEGYKTKLEGLQTVLPSYRDQWNEYKKEIKEAEADEDLCQIVVSYFDELTESVQPTHQEIVSIKEKQDEIQKHLQRINLTRPDKHTPEYIAWCANVSLTDPNSPIAMELYENRELSLASYISKAGLKGKEGQGSLISVIPNAEEITVQQALEEGTVYNVNVRKLLGNRSR